jgi:phytoene synthase
LTVLVRRWLDTAGITDPVLRQCYTHCGYKFHTLGDAYSRVLLWAAPIATRPYLLALGGLIVEGDGRADTGPVPMRRQRVEEWIAGFYSALDSGHSSDPVLHAAAHAARTVWDSPPRDLFEEMFGSARRDAEFTEFITYQQWREWAIASTGGPARVYFAVATSLGDGIADLACEWGELFQLVDCLADLSEDLADGRLYLPLEDLDRFGVDRADLAAGRWSTAMAELIAFEAARISDRLPSLRARTAQYPGGAPFAAGADAVLRVYHDAVLDAGAAVLHRKAMPPPGALVEAGLDLRRLAIPC